MTKENALEEMKKPAYDSDLFAQDYPYVLKKLGLNEKEFEEMMKSPARSHLDFESYLKSHYRYHEKFFQLFKPITTLLKKFDGNTKNRN